MSLTTFATLKTAIADWAWSEVTTTQVNDDIFPQMQSMMYWGDRTPGQIPIEPLRIKAMVSSATITPDTAGTVTLSSMDAAWLEFIELTPVLTGAISMQYVEPWMFRKQQDLLQTTSGPQFIYTIEGDTLFVAPKHTGNITAYYYEKFTALSADGDTDWVLTNAPQVYMSGCLMLAARYVQDEREQKFRSDFAGAIAGLNLSDKRRQTSGAPVIARPRVVV